MPGTWSLRQPEFETRPLISTKILDGFGCSNYRVIYVFSSSRPGRGCRGFPKKPASGSIILETPAPLLQSLLMGSEILTSQHRRQHVKLPTTESEVECLVVAMFTFFPVKQQH